MGLGTDSADAHSLRATATYEAERRIAWLRLVIMASGSVLFPFVSGRPGMIPWLGYLLLASGWAYTIAVLVVEPYRRYSVFRSATVTTVSDAVMTLAWVGATGGLESPWAIALYAMIIALSFRQGPTQIALGAVLSAAGYIGMGAALGQLGRHGVDVAVHVLYFFFTAATGALIAHERHRHLASRVRLLDMAQEVAQVGSWEWSIADNELQWSESLHRMFGLAADVKPSFEAYVGAIAPEDRARVTETIQKAREDLQPFRFDHRIVRPDGSVRWLHCRGRVVVASDGRPTEMFGSAQDVTERRDMQSQLVLSSKLASLGTLASGIAHEINNPLAYVSNNLEILERRLKASDPELQQAVAAARHGSTRVRDIVRGLRTFSRVEDDRRAPVEVAQIADLAIAMVGHEVEPRAQVVREYEPTPPVEANESRLSQVLVNLLVNAAHAIEPGASSENRIRVCVRPSGEDRVAIEVSDTGTGIPDENLSRIFDPFFTTKPPGVGNGLGLSICHGIVTDLGGSIEIATSPAGTTFRVLLPIAAASAAPATATEPPRSPRPRTRVLVVDDEERYAQSLKMLLEPERIVTVCLRARDALDLLASGETFDAVLCDLMMPGMTGMALHAELGTRGLDADRIIFLTGGPTNDEARSFLERDDVRHLVKPVDLPDLERALDDLISERRSAAA